MFQLISKLVMKNFRALRTIIIPFVLASSVMMGMQYIMLSIINNDYIQHRHKDLPQLLIYSNILIGILTVIFIIYANHFVMKQRKKEFALNMVLGLEKKHLRLMLLLETILEFIVISLLSVIGGYLFGNLVFLLLNRLVESKGMSLMDYPFDLQAMTITIIMLCGVMFTLFIINNIVLTLQSPVQLMRSELAGEKPAKKWLIIILFIIGVIALGYGYHIALTVEGVLNALSNIFQAILAVIIGTYCLFMSLTLLVLQFLKSRDGIYYRQERFFVISGLLSRMKANAVGLASIAMLITFLMVTLGMTFTAYRGIESQAAGKMINDYDIDFFESNNNAPKVMNDIKKVATVDKFRLSESASTSLIIDENKLIPLADKVRSKFDGNKLGYAVIITEKNHNIERDEQVSLKPDEIMVSSNADRFSHFDKLFIMNKEVKVNKAKKDYLGNAVAIDALYIIVPDEHTFEQYRKHFTFLNSKGEHPAATSQRLTFNVVKNEMELKKIIPQLEKKYAIQINNIDDVKKVMYELNGGLIFIGIVVSIVLMTGIFLVLYYKQLSEGYEDKRNYSIMKKVGLPQRLIKHTINQQIIWIFGLPIVIGLIHTLFANKIIFNLLGVLGIRDKAMFFTSYGIVILAIMVIYGTMYLITSRTYYKIINKR